MSSQSLKNLTIFNFAQILHANSDLREKHLCQILEKLVNLIITDSFGTGTNNNNGRMAPLFNVAGYLIEERRRWLTASPRGQCSK